MKLEVAKDRLEINKIIENVLPLMIMNKNLTQDCADCIIVYFIEKEESTQKTSEKNNIHPTKQTIQKGRGDVLNKDVDSVASIESKTGDSTSKATKKEANY